MDPRGPIGVPYAGDRFAVVAKGWLGQPTPTHAAEDRYFLFTGTRGKAAPDARSCLDVEHPRDYAISGKYLFVTDSSKEKDPHIVRFALP
jgi:hypothetical protein